MAYGKLKVDIIESSTEALTLPTSAGTTGQSITTDGSGNLTFTTVSTTTNLANTASGTALTVTCSTGTNTDLPAATTSAWGVMTDEDKSKLDAIETSATADQTGAEIKAAYEAESDTNAFTDADHSKLDAIEASATADQTNAEIRAAVEAATDSNVFTDSDHTKLNAIETSATADQTGAEIKAAYEGESDTNAFTDADHTKLDAIEASADVTDTANVVAALTAGTNVAIANDGTISSTDTTYAVGDGGLSQVSFTTADNTKLDGIAASANNYSISSDLLDEDNFATNSATKPASQQSIKAYVDSEVTALIGGAPGALDTLNELAASIGDDSDYAATITTALGLKAPIASPTFTGTIAIPNVSNLESAVTANTAKVTADTTNVLAALASATVDCGTYAT